MFVSRSFTQGPGPLATPGLGEDRTVQISINCSALIGHGHTCRTGGRWFPMASRDGTPPSICLVLIC